MELNNIYAGGEGEYSTNMFQAMFLIVSDDSELYSGIWNNLNYIFIWTELPINYQVICKVNNLATKDNHTEMTKGYPFFEWIPRIPIIDPVKN